MKIKILTILFGIIFLIGIANATNTLNSTEGITIPVNTIAGNTFTANFSFDYISSPTNNENASLVLELNFSSNNLNYPVWKNDFQVNGIAEKYILYPFAFFKQAEFNCSESAPLTIANSVDTITISAIPNGTFYCYNTNGNLKLNEHDEIFLNVTSNPSIYPGNYNLTAQMFYLNGTTISPFQIIIKILGEEEA